MHPEKFEIPRGERVIRGRKFTSPGARRAVILCHGFMANQRSVKKYARQFAKNGYAAFTFDFCGGSVIGASSGRTQDMSVLTERDDLLAVIGYVRGLGYPTPVLMGCSQGGLVCALTAAALADGMNEASPSPQPAASPAQDDKNGCSCMIPGLILFYPALCIPDDARRGHMMFARFDPAHVPETFSCGPMKLGRRYAMDVMDMDAYREIARYPGKTLLVHGTDDRIVPFAYSERAAAVMPDAALFPIQGAGHGFTKKEDRIALPRVMQFLQNLPGNDSR